MSRLDFLEDYFVKIHKNFGISKLAYRNNRLDIDDKYIRNMVFASDDFNNEFDNLLDHCRMIYNELQTGFSLKIKRDLNNNYFVLVV